MRNVRLWTAAILAAAVAAPALAGPPAVGSKAPPIKAGTWLNLPKGLKGLSANDLKGRIIFLDFWATW